MSQFELIRDTSLSENSVLYRKEYKGGIMIHSSGFGATFQKTKKDNAFKKHFWETSILYYSNLKEIKTSNPWYSNSKSYVYGKLNDIVVARFGFGGARQISRKPYQGGVEINFSYSGGVSLGIAKPVYLYVVEYIGASQQEAVLAVRKYDPNDHFYDNIYGRASFFEGIWESKFYPGVYSRVAFDFEFGNYEPLIRSLELGMAFDMFPFAIPSMAFNNSVNLFTHFYISISIGKRYN